MRSVHLSKRAFRLMYQQLLQHPDDETGGFLLGYFHPRKVKIVEATDGGILNAVHKKNEFQYDVAYVRHVSNLLSELYDPPLELIGVWHSHTHCLEPAFSLADEELHTKIAKRQDKDCVSVLFQKEEAEIQQYRMRAFLAGENTGCREVPVKIT